MRHGRPGRPRVVLITPVHNEAKNLARYESEVRRVLLDREDLEARVLFVEDGSRDASWDTIEEICRRDDRFRGLRLSRNFGPHAAVYAGLQQADGDAVVILACDLQDPPETVAEFVEQWRRGARIVWGRRRTRADMGWRILASRFFENLLRRYAMPAGSRFTTGSFLLMDRRVLDCYRQFNETNRVTFALVAWTGFEQVVVDYDRRARLAGKSSWNVTKLVKAAYDTLLAFSRMPFGLMAASGVSVFLASIPFSMYLVWCSLTGNPEPGWVSAMLMLTSFFALQCIFTGIQGEYLARIYAEVVRRPPYFISETTDSQEERRRDAA